MTIYNICGFGKGKTTSAIGIAARALGNGEKVLFCQFLKNGKDRGLELLKAYDPAQLGFKHLAQGTEGFNKEDCSEFWNECMKDIEKFKPNLIVFDELNVALDNSLFNSTTQEMVSWIEYISQIADVYITGRINKHELRHQMIKISDIATNAYCEKHYYNVKCLKCNQEFTHYYKYCPLCGKELKQRQKAKAGREC